MLKLKKHLSIVLALIVSVILLIPEMAFTVLADESTSDLFNYDKVQDVAVIIEYEHDDISFTITSPSGQKIDKNTDTDNITVFKGSTSTTVFIGGAEAGQWTITYDKGSNDHLTVRSVVQNTEFWIKTFNVGALSEEKLPVTFNVSGAENTGYSYSVMATTSKDTLNGKELASGNGNTGEDVAVEVSLANLSTYNEYYLLLYVSYDDNSSEIFDYAYSESFSYTNSKSPDPIDKVDITVAHDSKSITVDWDSYISYNTDAVYVEYYLDDELISSSEYPTSKGKSGFFTYDDETQSPLFKISVRENSGLASELSEFSVNIVPDNSLKLTLPESGMTGSDIWSFDYTGADKTEVTFTINDNSETMTLDGDGSSSITLPDTRNTIMVSYADKDGYIHTYNRMANITTAAPSLTLSHNIDGITTTNDFIIISGATNCSDVTINGNKAEVSDGTFTYTLELDKGENSILIEATNGELGTSLTATVTRETESILASEGIFSKLLPLIVGLVISVVGIILIIVFTKKRNSRKNGDNTYLNTDTKAAKKAAKLAKKNSKSSDINNNDNVQNINPKKSRSIWLYAAISSWIVTVGLWVWFIIRKVFENSISYIKLAYESLSRADAYLTHTVIILVFAIVFTVLAIVFTVVFVLIRLRKKNKPNTF